jgi:hypothetical protein
MAVQPSPPEDEPSGTGWLSILLLEHRAIATANLAPAAI